MGSNRTRALGERIASSKLFKNYERDFSETTRMPLSFHSVESWQLAHQGKKFENPFYALLAQTNRACGACLQRQQKIRRPVARTQNMMCFAGLIHSAVPVWIGDQLLGFLQTGQVALKKPSSRQFEKIIKQLVVWGVKTNLHQLKVAYFDTQVVLPKAYRSMVRLLEEFCQHLTLSLDRIMIQWENTESLPVIKAKQFIKDHQSEDISSRDVAKVVNVSSFYFCKLFKKGTGMTFTEYLSQVRITKAKNLLLNPHFRVSEIACQIGYQSLTHFNRTFHQIVGQSPTAYREAVSSVLHG